MHFQILPVGSSSSQAYLGCLRLIGVRSAQIGTDNFQRLSLAIVYQQVGMEAVALARTNLLTALL